MAWCARERRADRARRPLAPHPREHRVDPPRGVRRLGDGQARDLLRGPGRLRRGLALVGGAAGAVLGRRRRLVRRAARRPRRPGADPPGDARRRVVPRDDAQPRRAGPAARHSRAPGADRRRRGRRPRRDLVGVAARAGRRVRRDAAAARRPARRPGGRLPPNVPEAIVAFLGAASIGAVWSSCAPDFGTRAVLDRFVQIEPTVLVAVDGYRFNGKDVRPPGRRRRAARGDAERADDDRRPAAVPVGAARRGAEVGRRRGRRAGAGVRVAALRPPAVDRLLVGHDRAAQGDRARARRGGAGAAQAVAAAHGHPRRRPVLLVRLDRLDHVEHLGVRAAHRRHGGGLRRRPDLSLGRRPVRPRRPHRHHVLRHQPGLPRRLREGGGAAGGAARPVRGADDRGRPGRRCRRRPSGGSTTR